MALEQLSGTGVGHELARAAHSCTRYGKLTHKEHVYVYDNDNVALRRRTEHSNIYMQ